MARAFSIRSVYNVPWFHRAGGESPAHLSVVLLFSTPAVLSCRPAARSGARVLSRCWPGSAPPLVSRDAVYQMVSASSVRFLALHTPLQSLPGRTADSYGSPWCVLGFWHGAILLAGAGASVLVDGSKYHRAQLAMKVAIALGLVRLGGQAWQASANEKFFFRPEESLRLCPKQHPIFSILSPKSPRLRKHSRRKNTAIKNTSAATVNIAPLPSYFRGYDSVLLGNKIAGRILMRPS